MVNSVNRQYEKVDVVSYADREQNPVGFMKSQAQLSREMEIAREHFKLLRKELGNCYRTHGVNHYVECKTLRDEYGKLLQDPYQGAQRPK